MCWGSCRRGGGGGGWRGAWSLRWGSEGRCTGVSFVRALGRIRWDCGRQDGVEVAGANGEEVFHDDRSFARSF